MPTNTAQIPPERQWRQRRPLVLNPRKVNMPTLSLADPKTWQDNNPPPITPGGISVRSAYADPVATAPTAATTRGGIAPAPSAIARKPAPAASFADSFPTEPAFASDAMISSAKRAGGRPLSTVIDGSQPITMRERQSMPTPPPQAGGLAGVASKVGGAFSNGLDVIGSGLGTAAGRIAYGAGSVQSPSVTPLTPSPAASPAVSPSAPAAIAPTAPMTPAAPAASIAAPIGPIAQKGVFVGGRQWDGGGSSTNAFDVNVADPAVQAALARVSRGATSAPDPRLQESAPRPAFLGGVPGQNTNFNNRASQTLDAERQAFNDRWDGMANTEGQAALKAQVGAGNRQAIAESARNDDIIRGIQRERRLAGDQRELSQMAVSAAAAQQESANRNFRTLAEVRNRGLVDAALARGPIGAARPGAITPVDRMDISAIDKEIADLEKNPVMSVDPAALNAGGGELTGPSMGDINRSYQRTQRLTELRRKRAGLLGQPGQETQPMAEEGDTVEDQSGRQYIIRNGVPVPV